MASVNPYLNFNGNCQEAFDFYKSVFGTEYAMVMKFSDVPQEFQGPSGLSGDEGNMIMHIGLPIGNGSVLMGSDVPSSMPKAIEGTNFYISISAESKEEADKLFNGLSQGGAPFMPMDNAFWGAYFGMLKDKYNVHWMISYDANMQ